MMMDQMQIVPLSEHIAAGVSLELKKHGGMYLILVLDVVKPTWNGPKHAILPTLTGVN